MEKCCPTVNTYEADVRATEAFAPRLSGPGVTQLSDSVWYIDGVLSETECQSLIDYSGPRLQRSTVLRDENWQDTNLHQDRTSKNDWVLASELSDKMDTPVFESLIKIEKATESITGLPIINQEGLQLLRYLEGEEYKPHHDFFHETGQEYEQVMAQGGQRLWTVFFYLNEVKEGGETFFPRQDVKISPKLGRAAVWKNIVDGKPYHPSLHWGKPPIVGTKWGATKWIREREFKGDVKADTLLRTSGLTKELVVNTKRKPQTNTQIKPRHAEEEVEFNEIIV